MFFHVLSCSYFSLPHLTVSTLCLHMSYSLGLKLLILTMSVKCRLVPGLVLVLVVISFSGGGGERSVSSEQQRAAGGHWRKVCCIYTVATLDTLDTPGTGAA